MVLERLGRLKNPMTSSGIETATFPLVAQCLNQLRYSVPPSLGDGRYQFIECWYFGAGAMNTICSLSYAVMLQFCLLHSHNAEPFNELE
jgi:hypothetical protein